MTKNVNAVIGIFYRTTYILKLGIYSKQQKTLSKSQILSKLIYIFFIIIISYIKNAAEI